MICITWPIRRNFMLIFPVTRRFKAGARLTLELSMGPVCTKSHPETPVEAPISGPCISKRRTLSRSGNLHETRTLKVSERQ
jgi:hypothetical protein